MKTQFVMASMLLIGSFTYKIKIDKWNPNIKIADL